MEINQSSLTALVCLFARAYHSLFDNPKIFDDFLARDLLSDEEFTRISGYLSGGINFFNPEHSNEFNNPQEALKWVVQTQIAPSLLARARYCEDKFNEKLLSGIKQYVILGAGMDTLAFRRPELRGSVSVFEVDHPATQQAKINRIKTAGWQIPSNLQFIPVDFASDFLSDCLKSNGFKIHSRSFINLLGVTYYLSKDYLFQILRDLHSLIPSGSYLVFDYADDTSGSSVHYCKMNAMARQAGEPMKSFYSFEELEAGLRQIGWQICEHLTPRDLEKLYFQNRPDYYHAAENTNLIFAASS
jgi:methyltransferase (TIGR00027 family)